MSEVTDFDELLLALGGDPSKVHNVSPHGVNLGADSQALGHVQPQPLHGDLQFDSMQTSNLDIANGVHLLEQGTANQHMVGIESGRCVCFAHEPMLYPLFFY